MVRTKISVTDVVVCITAVIIAVAILILPANSVSDKVYIKTDSEEFSYDISDSRTEHITSNGYHLTVNIEDGKVRVSESDCPDKVCVKSGEIKDSSKPVVCAPAKVIVRIGNSGGNTDADAIAGR